MKNTLETNTEILPGLAAALQEMQAEFESMRLEVILVPERHRTHDMGMVRVAVQKNAPWYRRLCGRYSSSRFRRNLAFDTRIKRAGISRILGRLCDGRATKSQYAADILAEARNRVRANPDVYALAVAGACESENENPF